MKQLIFWALMLVSCLACGQSQNWESSKAGRLEILIQERGEIQDRIANEKGVKKTRAQGDLRAVEAEIARVQGELAPASKNSAVKKSGDTQSTTFKDWDVFRNFPEKTNE